MKELRDIIKEYYLDYRNNYLTVSKFAEHNGLNEEQVEEFLYLADLIDNSKHPEE